MNLSLVTKHTKAGLTSASNAGLFCSTARRHMISAATYSGWHKYASAVCRQKQLALHPSKHAEHGIATSSCLSICRP